VSTAIVVGIFTLAGGALGAGVTALIEHMRSKHEDANRFHADRQAAYASFLAEAIKWATAVEHMTGQMDQDWVWSLGHQVRFTQFALLDLLSSEPVRNAARELVNCIEQAALLNQEYIRGRGTDKDALEELMQQSRQMVEMIDAFKDAARQELGIAA